jgi:DNA-binding NtrC family response regulator
VVCPGWDNGPKDFVSLLHSFDDFVSCPFKPSELTVRVNRLLKSKPSSHTVPEVSQRAPSYPIMGESRSFTQLIEKIPLLAYCDKPVLISGETGTGKEMIARAIHYTGKRQDKPFIPVNCGALPDHLFENEVFGHAKGAFTDASSAEEGLIAAANGGTLLLDEIDALSLAGQVKLLRFLQSGEYRPVGSSRSIIADVRIIAATNANLTERVNARLFREDLFYRMNCLPVFVPPLRERKEDIGPLARHFVNQYAREHGTSNFEISPPAMHKLLQHSWPGNVRELESVITRALILTCSQILQATDIELPEFHYDEKLGQNHSLKEAKKSTIRAFEMGYLTNLLAQCHGNITQAANVAGKDRRTLQRLLAKYRLEPHKFRS